MSDERKDRVEIKAGVVRLPEEFREVARLANRAGLEGFEVADVEYGLDLEAFHTLSAEAAVKGLSTGDVEASQRPNMNGLPNWPKL
jgi:hypothetical protein